MLAKKCDKEHHYSINFIDSNGLYAGFDLQPSCCESFGWILRLGTQEGVAVHSFTDEDDYNVDGNCELSVVNTTLSSFNFTGATKECPDTSEDGGSIFFEMKDDEGEILWLEFYNYHNGYYSHGFGHNVNGQEVESWL